MGASDGKAIGQWFGPNTIAQVLKWVTHLIRWHFYAEGIIKQNANPFTLLCLVLLSYVSFRKLCIYDGWSQLRVHVALDNTVIKEDIGTSHKRHDYNNVNNHSNKNQVFYPFRNSLALSLRWMSSKSRIVFNPCETEGCVSILETSQSVWESGDICVARTQTRTEQWWTCSAMRSQCSGASVQ